VARGPLNKAIDRLYEAFGAPVVARSTSIAEIIQPVADVEKYVPFRSFKVDLDTQGVGAANPICDLTIPAGTTIIELRLQINDNLIVNFQSQQVVAPTFLVGSIFDGAASRVSIGVVNAVLVAPLPQLNLRWGAAPELNQNFILDKMAVKGPRHWILADAAVGAFSFTSIFWKEITSPAA